MFSVSGYTSTYQFWLSDEAAFGLLQALRPLSEADGRDVEKDGFKQAYTIDRVFMQHLIDMPTCECGYPDCSYQRLRTRIIENLNAMKGRVIILCNGPAPRPKSRDMRLTLQVVEWVEAGIDYYDAIHLTETYGYARRD